jgi:hypothetical protein
MFRRIWPSSGVKSFSGGNCCYCMCPFDAHVCCAWCVAPRCFQLSVLFLNALNVNVKN